MKKFISGCIITAILIFSSVFFISKESAIINPKDVEKSIEICKYRGGLAYISAVPGEDIYYYCNDGYQALPAPAYINTIRDDFELYVKKEGLDMHLGFTDGKYSNKSTQEAFMLFCAGAEAK